ncbi:MAG: indolepyruvate ferredoxin oxidoreductase family protein [Candidatus Binatia bacterium]
MRSAHEPQAWLDRKYLLEKGLIYLTGLQALVRLPMDQHRADRRTGLHTATFVSGYRGSPLGGLDRAFESAGGIARAHQIVFANGVNEELAATAVVGSQMASIFPGAKYDGVLGMWYGKAPGVDRAGDALRHGNFVGVGSNGGVLCIAGDDPACKSSTLPSATEQVFVDAMFPVLYPGTVQEVLDLGRHGFMLSRYSGLWVGMKIVSDVADEAATAEVAPERVAPVFPSFDVGGRPFRPRLNPTLLPPSTLHAEREMIYERLEAARLYARANGLNRITVAPASARLGIIAGGKTYYDLRQALRTLGLDEPELHRFGIRLLRMGLLHPVEGEIMRELARGLEEVIVVEEKRPYLETALRDLLYSGSDRPRVVGKWDEEGRPLLPADGALDVDTIARAVGGRIARTMALESVRVRLAELDAARALSDGPIRRAPSFCSGCPHNRSTLVPEGSLAGGGIGCHGMVLWKNPQHVGITQMGGEGAQWIGMAPFTETPHFFQNLGDGTLAHSASLAINASIAAGVNVTYKILYNSAVAMTGGQEAAGLLPIPELTRSLEIAGVRKIIITAEDPRRYADASLAGIAEVWHRDRLDEAQQTLRDVTGVSVLIHDQRCAAESRRLRKRKKLAEPATRVYINEAVCEGCGDCGKKANCLSLHPVETEFGRKTQVHQSSCNQDYSCLLGDCPSFITVDVEPARSPGARPAATVEHFLPAPVARVDAARGYRVFMAGIGGTGVVTINQILGTAAALEGKHVRSLDQTGLAQKGGPVVSSLRILDHDEEANNCLATGEADLLLVFDLVVGTQAKNLAKAHRERSAAVVNTDIAPTAAMIGDPDAPLPTSTDLIATLSAVSRPDALVSVPASTLAEELFGDQLATNMILVGAAYQSGWLPLAAASIEEAIRINGAAAEMNVQAFRLGRRLVIEPTAAESALRQRDQALPATHSAAAQRATEIVERCGFDAKLRGIAEVRARELAEYQNFDWARRYVAFVQEVAQVERQRVPGSTRLSEAVARSLFKLMAYKDEYEVARLHLRSGSPEVLRRRFPRARRLRWHLHPPLLRSIGLRKKVGFGPWITGVFRGLHAMRHLRGSWLDPFGHTEMRRLERALIDEYRTTIATLLRTLSPEHHDGAVAIAEAAELVRGYEEVKIANVTRYRHTVAELMKGFADRRPPSPGVPGRVLAPATSASELS